jgi:hypothetical protein
MRLCSPGRRPSLVTPCDDMLIKSVSARGPMDMGSLLYICIQDLTRVCIVPLLQASGSQERLGSKLFYGRTTILGKLSYRDGSQWTAVNLCLRLTGGIVVLYVILWEDKSVQKNWLRTETLRTLLLGID